MIDYFCRLFAYDEWANREALAALRRFSTPPPRAAKLIAHIIAAEWLWLCRMQHKPSPLPVWPDLTLDEAGQQLSAVASAWRQHLTQIQPADLERITSYTNTKGERWENTVQDVLMHAVMHGAYHRGQIAMDLRASGNEPPYTDFIEAVRRGKIG